MKNRVLLTAVFFVMTVIQSAAIQQKSVTGDWELTVKFIDQDRSTKLRFVQEGEKLLVYKIRPSGEVVGEPDVGNIKGNELEWSGMIRGDRDVILLYKGKFDGTAIKGDLYFGDRSVYEWTAIRIDGQD